MHLQICLLENAKWRSRIGWPTAGLFHQTDGQESISRVLSCGVGTTSKTLNLAYSMCRRVNGFLMPGTGVLGVNELSDSRLRSLTLRCSIRIRYAKKTRN